MKRINIMGLCLVAVFAMSAVLAASASAATPEYKWCVAQKKGNYTESGCLTVAEKKGKPDHKGGYEAKTVGACVAQKKGNFTESACETVAEKKGKPDHKGGYELIPPGGEFTSTLGTSTLVTHSTTGTPEDVVCTGGKDAGEITGPSSDEETITFEGCEASGNKCENVGAGKIETERLGSYLLAIPFPAETEVGDFLTSLRSNVAVFTCGAETVELTGEVIGKIANTGGGETISFSVSGGHQEVFGYAGYTLKAFGEESTLAGVDTQTGPGAYL